MRSLTTKAGLLCFSHMIRCKVSPSNPNRKTHPGESFRHYMTRGNECTNLKLVASRRGLDPKSNKFHAPIVYHENYSFADWPKSHTFPMTKFDRIAHALMTTCKKTQPHSPLPHPLVENEKHFFRPYDMEDIPRSWLLGPMLDEDFVNRFLNGQLTKEECRYIGFREQTCRPELIERTVLEVAGTVLACQLACHYGIAVNVAGGTHHAHPRGGAGYTILNDLAISTYLLTRGNDEKHHNEMSRKFCSIDLGDSTIERVLVVDCDVHQGDGTAKFAAQVPALKNNLFTLSLHCASNYPQLKAHSTFDVGLADGIRDEEYLNVLAQSLEDALEKVDPDFVLYDAGVDIYEKDKLGRLNVSEEGIRQRDRFVLNRCVSAGIPVAAVVGGGYDEDVDALARRHAIVHEECSYVWRKYKMWENI